MEEGIPPPKHMCAYSVAGPYTGGVKGVRNEPPFRLSKYVIDSHLAPPIRTHTA